MYSGLGLPPQALAPMLGAIATRTDAFGVNFLVGVMDRSSLELAVERAPYVDFFLSRPIARSSRSSMRATGSAVGRSSR